MKASIALVDDHVLIRNGMAALLEKLGYSVVFEADNGADFIEKLRGSAVPDVVLMDVHMPVMDGFETSMWIKRNAPSIHILALSMFDDETAIIRMIRCGAKGYILKDCFPLELKNAIQSLLTHGFYQSGLITGKMIHSINRLDDGDDPHSLGTLGLNPRETEFLKLACTEMTYKEIADAMSLSPRTIDGYRESLFEKLNTKSRTGLVLFAIKNGIVRV